MRILSKKRCGIITIHNVPNYGATLQAYSLLYYINNQPGIEAELIDYHMNSNEQKHVKPGNIMTKFLIKAGKIRYIKRYFDIKKREKSFAKFWDKYYIKSAEEYFGDRQFALNPPRYDLYIAGSDQLFNINLTNQSYAYFFKYNKGKKISYSTSFGMDGLSQENMIRIKEMLNDFYAISIREKSASRFLQESIRKKITVTADPVFLLSKKEWESLCLQIDLPSRYIFCYLMSDNPNISETINWLVKKEKMPIYVMHTYKGKMIFKSRIVNDLSPQGFLTYIRNATYVVTNSFHGSALSIIFGSNLFSLEEQKYVGDQRFEAMFEAGDIVGKRVPYDADWGSFDFNSYLIEGDKAYEKMGDWIEMSKDFLNNSLR